MRPINAGRRVMPARWLRTLAATAVTALAFAGLVSTGNADAAEWQSASTPSTADTPPEAFDSDIGDAPIVGPNTEWKYWDQETDPAAGLADLSVWAQPEFDDSSWKVAQGSFGAKYGELADLDGGYLPNTLLN